MKSQQNKLITARIERTTHRGFFWFGAFFVAFDVRDIFGLALKNWTLVLVLAHFLQYIAFVSAN